ncbi:MAG: 5'-nucleotidase C-terminal domain-containing protein [Blastocatellia bacterium]|nr:5'-nucleotidase C-terminal domain-containing protein [Blastocatellia bacterium]
MNKTVNLLIFGKVFLLLMFLSPATFAQQASVAKTEKPKATRTIKKAKHRHRAAFNYESSSKFQQIGSDFAEDSSLLDMIKPYSENVRLKMNTVIGHTKETINKEGPAAGKLGRLMTDIIRDAATKATRKKIDMGFQNNGGIRAEIPAGDITIGTIFQLMPFDNEITTIELTGSDLIALFESMAPNIVGFGAAISGAELKYAEGKFVSATVGGNQIDPNHLYTMAITDYLYSGGGDYPLLRRGKNYSKTGVLLRDAIIDYIKSEQAAGREIVAPEKARVEVDK